MTDNKGHQEKERLLARETKEGSLKELVALGIGLGGWLAFGHLPRAGRDEQKETLHNANLLAGGGIQSHPVVDLGCNGLQPRQPHGCTSGSPSWQEASLIFF